MGFFSFHQKLSEIPLPMEVVMEEILTRLPAKSLMRFKCVSKLWSCHIISRYFTNRSRVLSRPHPRLYIWLGDLRTHKYITLTSVPKKKTPSTFVVDHTIRRKGGYILQNLGGFMCYCFMTKPRIFNPATSQLITLPAPSRVREVPYCFEHVREVSYYFGHDPVNDQYKVICSIGFGRFTQTIRSEHWVFVLKPGGGSWKKLAPEFCPHIPVEKGLCIDGVIYYRARIGTYNYAIVSFHIRSEEFKIIQVSCKDGDPRPERFRDLSLVDFAGKLTLIDLTNLRDEGMLDLWVLEDATYMEWSRKSLILQPSQLPLVNNTTFYVRGPSQLRLVKNTKFDVRGTTQNGKLLLIPEDFICPFHVLCYDLQSNDMRKIEIKGIPDYWFDKYRANVGFDLMFMDQSENITHLET